jgi:hypothetical protein
MPAGPALRSVAAVATALAFLPIVAPADARTPRIDRRLVTDGDCSQIAAFVPVPVERVRRRIPPGFAIVGEDAGTALVLVTGGRCGPWRLDGRRVHAMEFGLVSVLAHPEGDPPSAAGYDLWWLFDARSTVEAWAGVGFFTRKVPVSYRLERGPGGGVTSAVATARWARSPFRVAGTVIDGPPPGLTFPSQHWYDGPYGRVRSDHENTEAGVDPALVTITTAPDSALARILGAQTTRIAGGFLEFHHHAVTRVERD